MTESTRIDTEEIADFVYKRLIEKHFVPSEKEIKELSTIFFDYLLHKNIIREVD